MAGTIGRLILELGISNKELLLGVWMAAKGYRQRDLRAACQAE